MTLTTENAHFAPLIAEIEAVKAAPALVPGQPLAHYPDRNDFNLACPLFYKREEFVKTYGFMMPTAEVIDVLTGMLAKQKTLEAGSGSGWLADQLSQRGIDIEAADWTDYRLPKTQGRRKGYPFEQVFRLDHHGDATRLLPGTYGTILLVWPNLGSAFAAKIAQRMSTGQRLIYCGEGQGGCTANEHFFEILKADFIVDRLASARLNAHHWQFPGIHDRWLVLSKQ